MTLGPHIDNTALAFRQSEGAEAHKPRPLSTQSLINIKKHGTNISGCSQASNTNIFRENNVGLFEWSMSIHCQLGI